MTAWRRTGWRKCTGLGALGFVACYSISPQSCCKTESLRIAGFDVEEGSATSHNEPSDDVEIDLVEGSPSDANDRGCVVHESTDDVAMHDGESPSNVLFFCDADFTGGFEQLIIFLPDLRSTGAGPVLRPRLTVRRFSDSPSGECVAEVSDAIAVEIEESVGEAAPEPEVVTDDFLRRIHVTIDLEPGPHPGMDSLGLCTVESNELQIDLTLIQSADDYRRILPNCY